MYNYGRCSFCIYDYGPDRLFFIWSPAKMTEQAKVYGPCSRLTS